MTGLPACLFRAAHAAISEKLKVPKLILTLDALKSLKDTEEKVFDVQQSTRRSTSILVSQAATNHLSGHVAPQEA